MVMTNQQQKKIVHLYSDGACLGNPGPGGWGVVLSWDGQMKELSGGQALAHQPSSYQCHFNSN